MKSNIVDLVPHIDMVTDLWDYLEVLYLGHNNMAYFLGISRIFGISRDRQPFTQFFADFKKLYEEYNSLLPLSSKVAKMKTHREQLAVMRFLHLAPNLKVYVQSFLVALNYHL